MSKRDYLLGLGLVTASAVAWSTAGLFTRLIPLDTWTMLAWRGIFGAFGIVAVSFIMDGRKAWLGVRGMGWPGWLFAIVSAVGMIFFITSLRHTTVAHVSVIYATVPFLAASLDWVATRERPTGSAVSASVAALLGVALMVGLSRDGGLLGDGLALGMTLCMAAMMVIARLFREIPVMPAAALSALLSGLVCWPLGNMLAPSGYELVLLALFGLVNSALGLALFTLGARCLPAIETALVGALDAPLAPFWVWLACSERPSAGTLVGGLVVFIAVGVHIIAESRRHGSVFNQ